MYDSSTKGSDGMTKLERFAQLDGLLAEQDGMLQTSQAVARGIVKPTFYEYMLSLEKVLTNQIFVR